MPVMTSVIDNLLSLLVVPSAWILRHVRSRGLMKYPRTGRILASMGILPIRDHYYEPYLSEHRLHRGLDTPRVLPGLDMRLEAQLHLLSSFCWQDELADFQMEPTPLVYGYRNRNFGPIDACLLYCMVRHLRPRKIIEIGCGMSTLVIRKAVERGGGECDHLCIEPFENPWLEKLPVQLARVPAERMNPEELAGSLHSGDLLFIDSSHVVKPQGDVLFIVQELLPRLETGVVVHFHDIFTPRDYPASWLLKARVLWAEQYLLESYLCENQRWEVILSANMLAEERHQALAEALPLLLTYPKGILPGFVHVFPNSLYIRRK